MADLVDIINTIIAEAYGEGPEGMRRVGETVLNRAAIRGIDPAAVVRQPHQYTGFGAPGPAAVAAQQDPIARSAAEAAWQLARQPGDPTGGADHYKANYVNPGWASKMPQTGSYGAHDFYKSREVPQDALSRLLAPSAPTPFAPPARGNVPSDLIARSMANSSAAQSRSSVADMFGPAVSGSTPRMTGAGAVANPSAISTDWARDIFPDTSRRATPIIAGNNLTQGSAISDVLAALTQKGSLQDALRQKINSQGTTVASFPSAPAARSVPAMPTRTTQSYAGQERAPTSGVGKAPATRAVQSVTMPAAKPAAAPKVNSVGSMPSFAAFADALGAKVQGGPYNPTAHGFAGGPPKSIPGPNGYTNNSKTAERIPSTPGSRVNSAAPGPHLFGGLDPSLAGPAPLPKSPQLAQAARAPKPAIMAPVIEPAATRIAQAAPKVSPQAPTRRPVAPRNARVAITSPQVPARRPDSVIASAQASRPASAMAYAQPTRRAVSPAAAAIAQSFNTGGGGSSGGSTGGGSFQGTATGNSYNAGQRYQTGDGRVLEANSDGSFTNVSTGQKSVGSSRR